MPIDEKDRSPRLLLQTLHRNPSFALRRCLSAPAATSLQCFLPPEPSTSGSFKHQHPLPWPGWWRSSSCSPPRCSFSCSSPPPRVPSPSPSRGSPSRKPPMPPPPMTTTSAMGLGETPPREVPGARAKTLSENPIIADAVNKRIKALTESFAKATHNELGYCIKDTHA